MKPYISSYLAHCFFFFTKTKNVKMNDQTVIGSSRTREAGKNLNSTADDTRTSPNNAANLATCVSIKMIDKGFFHWRISTSTSKKFICFVM